MYQGHMPSKHMSIRSASIMLSIIPSIHHTPSISPPSSSPCNIPPSITPFIHHASIPLSTIFSIINSSICHPFHASSLPTYSPCVIPPPIVASVHHPIHPPSPLSFSSFFICPSITLHHLLHVPSLHPLCRLLPERRAGAATKTFMQAMGIGGNAETGLGWGACSPKGSS